MKAKKTALTIALLIGLAGWALLAAGPDAAFVRVAVRYAKARILPAADARVAKEIGFGTMLQVLKASGDYYQVAELNAPVTAEAWYVLRGEVEPASLETAQAVLETRRVTVSPSAPFAGQSILFKASGFAKPNLLKWAMGDGTELITGGKASGEGEATLAYAYAAPGRYLVKVYDGGNESLPPVTVQVAVSASVPALRVDPELPTANHPLVITAVHFSFPEKIAWDLGDGTQIGPADAQGAVKAMPQISHLYANEGTFTVKAYDGGDRTRKPVAVDVRVAADRRRVYVQPDRAVSGETLEFTAVAFDTPETLRWDMGDGTIFAAANGKKAKVGSLISYSYRKPGPYEVKVYDWNGNAELPPVRLSLVVLAKDEPLAATEKTRPAERVSSEALVSLPPAVDQPAPARKRKKYPLIKIGPYAGYFQPQNGDFKSIYGDGDVLYGARLGLHAWKGFYLWLSFSQFKSIAQTSFTKDKTTMTLLPASAFLRFEIGQKFLIPYAGVGYTFMSFKEESPDFLGNTKGKGANAALEAGFELKVNRHLYIDLGARFDQVKCKPENSEVEIDLGGLQAGISLLISF